MVNAMAHLFQEYLDENAHKLGSGLYKELSDKIMNLSREMQERCRNARLTTITRIVSAIPSAIKSVPVLELTESKDMFNKFLHELVNHKIQEVHKLPNIQLRSAMISAWKDDIVDALLADDNIDKFKLSNNNQMHRASIQQCIEKLLLMKVGMLDRITKRLDEKGVTPSALFPINIAPGMAITSDNMMYHIPVVTKLLELEPLLVKWLLGIPKDKAWPDVHDLTVDGISPNEQSLRKAMLDYAERCGGNNTLINDNTDLSEIKNDDFQNQFNAVIFDTTYRPVIQTYGYDSSLGHALPPLQNIKTNVKRHNGVASVSSKQRIIAKRSSNRR